MSSLVDIGLTVLEKKIFKSCQCIFTILQLSPFESPLPKDALCQVRLKLAQWFLRRSRK